MQTAWKHKQGGFTLTEMIVVMAIIAIMGSIAIPAFVSMDAMNRNDMKNSAMELQRLLHAARVYAATHRVDTAVVYSLDNYASGNTTVANPVMDSLTDDFMRVIDAVAVYREEKNATVFHPVSGDRVPAFVPVLDKEGVFSKFPGEMVIYLSRPIGALNYEHYYMGNNGQYKGTGATDNTWKIGMRSIWLLPSGDLNGDQLFTNLDGPEIFPAHIFNPSGSMQRPGGETKERVTLFIGPSPTAPAEERLYDPSYPELFLPDDGSSNLQGRVIELFHATGKAKVVKD